MAETASAGSESPLLMERISLVSSTHSEEDGSDSLGKRAGGATNGAFSDISQGDDVYQGTLSKAFRARLAAENIKIVDEVLLPRSEITESVVSTGGISEDYSFETFAKENFNGEDHQHVMGCIGRSLLKHKHSVDSKAAEAVWIALLRFTGELSNTMPATSHANRKTDRTPVMTKIYRTLERHSRPKSSIATSTPPVSPGTEESEFELIKFAKSRPSLKKLMCAGGSDTLTERDVKAEVFEYDAGVAALMEKVPTRELDLVHFIIGHGILRRSLRDEIYCQLCKQTVNNPIPDSLSKTWMLIALCAGCFSPSEKFMPYLRQYLREVDPNSENSDYALYARKMLKRTMTNGMRYHPPNWLEYQATKLKKYVVLPVTFSDGQVETLEADPATTAAEMCTKLANKVGLKDQFGFSIYICIFDKVSSLGSGLDHVMDAICECEQVVRTRGEKEQDAPWRLFYRKEVFVPWHDPSYDPVANDLIYEQIVRGVQIGEYRLKQDEDIVKFAAQRYYVDHGASIVPGKVQQMLPTYLPEASMKSRNKDYWMQGIMSYFNEAGFNNTSVSQNDVKEKIVRNAAIKWPLQFSALFEVFKLEGSKLPRNDLVVAVCSKSVYVLDEPYRVIRKIRYYEMVEIFSSRTEKQRGQSFTIITVKGDEYTFLSPNSETVASLLGTFLDGLRRRSPFVVGLIDYQAPGVAGKGDSPNFRFRQGDTLILDKTGQALLKEGWCQGVCERTGLRGQFPADSVYILPCIEKPPEEFLSIFMRPPDTLTLPRKNKGGALAFKAATPHLKHGKESAA